MGADLVLKRVREGSLVLLSCYSRADKRLCSRAYGIVNQLENHPDGRQSFHLFTSDMGRKFGSGWGSYELNDSSITVLTVLCY